MSSNKNTSLFIPHVFPNFNKDYVAEAFADIGQVERVDFVAKQDRNGKPYNAAYIHFNNWYKNHAANRTLNDIDINGSAKFYHDNSEYYWILLPNTANKHISGERKVRIDLGESKSISLKTIEKISEKQCPGAPKKSIKPTYAEVACEKQYVNEKPIDRNLDAEFEECLETLCAPIEEWDVEFSEEAIEMAEMENILETEDENLVSIDYRYIQTIEQENTWLHGEVAQLRAALINLDQMYQAEAAKVRAFSNVEFSSVETSVDL